MCPEQQNKGSCKLTRCPYPHQTRTVTIEQSHIECTPIERRKQIPKCPSNGDHIKPSTAADKIVPNDQDIKLNAKRYFDDDDAAPSNDEFEVKRISKKDRDQTIPSSESSNTITSLANENVEKIVVVRKPIVGSLPSFIPIG